MNTIQGRICLFSESQIFPSILLTWDIILTSKVDESILGSERPLERFLEKHDSGKRKRKCIGSKGTNPKSDMSDHSDGL